MSEQTNRPRYHAVVKGGKPDKPIWNRIGAVFENENGSLKVMLNANPIDGQFWLFEAQDQNQSSVPQQAPAASTVPQAPVQPQTVQPPATQSAAPYDPFSS